MDIMIDILSAYPSLLRNCIKSTKDRLLAIPILYFFSFPIKYVIQIILNFTNHFL